jgi:hypothetical protein
VSTENIFIQGLGLVWRVRRSVLLALHIPFALAASQPILWLPIVLVFTARTESIWTLFRPGPA